MAGSLPRLLLSANPPFIPRTACRRRAFCSCLAAAFTAALLLGVLKIALGHFRQFGCSAGFLAFFLQTSSGVPLPCAFSAFGFVLLPGFFNFSLFPSSSFSGFFLSSRCDVLVLDRLRDLRGSTLGSGFGAFCGNRHWLRAVWWHHLGGRRGVGDHSSTWVCPRLLRFPLHAESGVDPH